MNTYSPEFKVNFIVNMNFVCKEQMIYWLFLS